MTDQQQHLEALGMLQQCLSELCQDQPDMLAGLCVFLHHPDNKSWWGSQGSFVEDNGSVTLIADLKTLRHDLLQLDLDEAQQRKQLSSMWVQKVSDKAAALTDLLGVQDVMFWSSKQPAREMFVQWADEMLEHRCADEGMMQRKTHSFNLLVQADSSLPVLHYDDLLGLLEVSTDCSPEQLLEYLQGEAATAASTAAVAHGRARQEEEELLEAASDALGTRHVMRMVSRYWQPDINRSLQQLIATADAVKAAFDLSDFAIAIDDRYEVTDSGLISIPWDFSTQDLQPQLLKLLSPESVKVLPPSAGKRPHASLTSCLTAAMANPGALRFHATHNLFTQFTGTKLLARQFYTQRSRHTACHQRHMRMSSQSSPSQSGCRAHLCQLTIRPTACKQSMRLTGRHMVTPTWVL
ncbi:hypothetical protein ABBQ32_009774 [Trebouxia sp. C0010 RCD-2024]